jgi:hypothetical protein
MTQHMLAINLARGLSLSRGLVCRLNYWRGRPLRNTVNEATKDWTVVSMKDDWKTIFPNAAK